MEEFAQQTNPEPRWPAFIAVLAGGGLYTALPAALTFGPRWLLPSVILALLIPTVISHHTGRPRLSAIFGIVVSGALILGLITSLTLLIGALPAHKTPPETLLVSAASLWATNILVFALWYWRLDAGGPALLPGFPKRLFAHHHLRKEEGSVRVSRALIKIRQRILHP